MIQKTPLYWDWSRIPTSRLEFPEHFLWGASTSAHQIEGGCQLSDWCKWEQMGKVSLKAEGCCDHWNRYVEDIALLKNMGLTAYRFSIDWCRVEPEPGVYDMSVLEHYEKICIELKRQGIMPVITLHHFASPLWFLNKGGFEQRNNLADFVEFSCVVFDKLQPYCSMWITINSPTSYAGRSYFKGIAPPGIKNAQRMQEVISNMLEAHVRVYQALKKRTNNQTIKIGIIQCVYQIDAGYVWDIIASKAALALLETNVYHFFRTGHFDVEVPLLATVKHSNHEAPRSLDFIGINYYSHGQSKNFKIAAFEEELPTQNPLYSIYPEGLYRAIKEVYHALAGPLKIPIYITENGISTDNERHRDLFFKRYLYALSVAAREFPVHGYFVWTLLDAYEWGSRKHYGLYSVDPQTKDRVIKDGTAYFIETVKNA
ncbi:beta-glucosidase [Candidatus Dependentiae bacterium Noda2021]|nr:beta-glucosidase [Candidatus Dependentiae bacterium Noda2021]